MKAPRLHILMAASRPRFIEKLISAYMEKMEPHPFELRWHLLIQGPEPDPKGILKTNEMLDVLKGQDAWFFNPSDDTEEHPALFRRLHEAVSSNPTCGAVVFSQVRPGGGVLQACPENMHPGSVDGSQVFWSLPVFGHCRYDWDQFGCGCDGHCIQSVYKNCPDRFVFVDEPLIQFGSLEW
jgi:hypothetical protein